MQTALRAGAGILVIVLASGCGGGSTSSPEKGQDFNHGTAVTAPGTPVEAPDWANKPYPEGPYGYDVGNIIPNLDLLGWKDPTAANFDITKMEPISLSDYYNPDGKGPGKILFFDSSAVWCPPCNAQYKAMRDEGFYDAEHPKGIEFFGTLMEDGANPPNPVKPQNVADWADKYEVHFAMGADPGFKLGPLFDYDAVPNGTIIDLRTMTILAKHPGGGSDLSSLQSELEGDLW